MALETLKGITKIGGFKAEHIEAEVDHEVHFGNTYIHVGSDNAIMFKIQNGPIKEHGVNGCQVDTLIHAAKVILEGLNKKSPSNYNKAAILGLELAINQLKARTEDREARGVEGKGIK